jgi:acyl carrier protein
MTAAERPATMTAAERPDIVLRRDELGLPGEAAPPANEAEQVLLGLWREVLEVEGLGVNDNFFAAGGDSLAAATLCAGVERDLGAVIPVSVLLLADTPRLLAREIEAVRAKQARSCLQLIRQGRSPAAALVHGLHGDVVLAKRLADLMADGRRILGFRAR